MTQRTAGGGTLRAVLGPAAAGLVLSLALACVAAPGAEARSLQLTGSMVLKGGPACVLRVVGVSRDDSSGTLTVRLSSASASPVHVAILALLQMQNSTITLPAVLPDFTLRPRETKATTSNATWSARVRSAEIRLSTCAAVAG